MAKQITVNDTKTFIPSSYYASSTATVNSSYPTDNGLGDSGSTSYAQFSATTSSTYARYNFSVNGIPQGASITAVSCVVKASLSNTSNWTTRTIQLYSNNTAKGSSTNLNSTNASVYTLSVGSWTVSELENCNLRITLQRSRNNASCNFYGATLSVSYTYQGTGYEITSVNNTDLVDSIDPEGVTDVISGEEYKLKIYGDSLDNVVVEDDGVDVTNQLTRKQNTDIVNTVSSVAQPTFTTGGSPTNVSFYTASTSTTTEFLQYPIGYTAESPRSTSITNTYVKSSSNTSGSTGWIIFDFDFSSIPENATIDSVQVKCYGSKESTTQSTTSVTRVSKVGLYSGTVLKSTEQEFTSTANTIMTISNPGTWTRTELQNAKLRFSVGYYGGYMAGITWNVTYTVPATTQYYWEYTLSNVSDDHTIMVSEAIIVPPDEDPSKEYYPITISSINASTDPGRGTTRIESGTSETITITPSDPQLTLALDNGVDITSQLVQHGGTIEDPTITTAPGASYGFNLNSSTGYYVSTNNGISKSASVARVAFNLPVRCLVTIQYINYAEANYDYGMFGKIDTAVATDGLTAGNNSSSPSDSTSNYQLAMASNSSSPQTITYEVPSGEHFIDIKYGKDDASDSNNDNLQWKITSIEPLESNNYYTYDLTNISQEHSLIFIFGDVTYYFVNSSTNGDCTLYPNGQMVQLPGDSYRLTIAPKNSGDTITMTDNNVDVTSQLERKEITTEKDGQTITVVNYIYRLSNIQATHNLVVSSASQGLIASINLNGQWDEGELKRKQDDRWGTLSYTRIWVHNGSAWIENAQRTITTNGMIFGGALT